MFKTYSTKISKCLAAGLLVIFIFAPSLFIPSHSLHDGKAYAGLFNDDLEVFEEVMDLIADKYVYPPDFKKIYSAAIKGMVTKAGSGTVSVNSSNTNYTVRIGNEKIRYKLNFSRSNNRKALKDIFYFLAKQPEVKLDKKDLEFAGIDGVMATLDPYSLYLKKEDFAKSMDDTEGKYGGLGMVITIEDLKLTVVKTMRNSPAKRAGIMSGDVITKVDGRVIKGMQIKELADKLRGHPNTKVSVTIHRPSTKKESSYTMTREIIAVETVEFNMLNDRTAYLKISSFSRTTNDQFKDALKLARKSKANGYVLDLRENPGGLLDQSVLIASHFLKKGKLVVYTQGRSKRDYMEYHSKLKKTLYDKPLVILLDRYSASASEIVAGSLRDVGKAIIAGQNSYGKGSVQTIFPLSDDSGLRLTTSKYFTPSGIDITKNGIVPEIMIIPDLPEDEKSKPSKRVGVKISLKESELTDYLKKKGVNVNKEDPLISFAQLVIKNSKTANKRATLAKAKELAKDIHY
ncbi:MAG: S41 family peptidase [Nitrospinales bacterium]